MVIEKGQLNAAKFWDKGSSPLLPRSGKEGWLVSSKPRRDGVVIKKGQQIVALLEKEERGSSPLLPERREGKEGLAMLRYRLGSAETRRGGH